MIHPVIALVVNFRDSPRTALCVQALLGGDVNEVIVWDNSADDGVSAAELSALVGNESRVTIEISQFNLGFAAAVNRGLHVCQQRMSRAWVLIINNDTVPPQDLARKLVDALAADDCILLAFPALMHAGHRLDDIYYQRRLATLSGRRVAGSFRIPRGCCFMLATDRWAEQLFDEDFFMYGEEIELGWRLRSKRGAMVFVHDALVDHEGSASSRLGSPFYETRTVAAHLILARKLAYNRVDACALYATRLPMLMTRALVRSLRFRSFVPWLALWQAHRIAFGNDPLLRRHAL